MNLGRLFKDFHLEKVKLNLKAVEFESSFQEADKGAAWDRYVKMLTRIVTQPLPQPVLRCKRAVLETLGLPPPAATADGADAAGDCAGLLVEVNSLGDLLGV